MPRLRFLLVAALLVASRLLLAQEAGLAGFDAETGLWFPPGATKEVYLSGSDPQHVYIEDVRKAFEGNDALRAAACEAMNLPRNQVSVRQSGPRIAQLRTMVDMLCLAVPFSKKSAEDQARVDAENERKWRAALDLAGARALPLDERDRKAGELCLSCETDPEKAMANALAALALKPYDDTVVAAVLDAHPFRGARPWQVYVRFLKALFAEETREGAPEAASWRLGQRSFHFFLGELTEARDLTRKALQAPAHRNENRVFLALLERMLGNREAFPALMASCPLPEEAAAEEEIEPFDCWDFARGLAVRGVGQLRDKAAPALLDVLSESIAAEPTEWDGRLEAIRAMAIADHARARVECEALLRIPATIAPLETRLGAVAQLARIAQIEKDHRRALAAYDRYLDLLEFHAPAAPPDLWKRLAALPGPPTHELIRGSQVGWALGSKISIAAESADLPLARRLLETYAALALSYADSSEPWGANAAAHAAWTVRYHLLELARAELKAGHRAEAARIAGFLYTQPHDDEKEGKVITSLSSLKSELSRGGPVELKAETSPWDRPESPAPRRAPARRAAR